MRTHRDYLKEQLRNSEFARGFHCEKQKLRISYDIHSARSKLGLSQKELGEKAGVTQQMVSRIETASKANMAHGTICRIAAALGMEVGLVAK